MNRYYLIPATGTGLTLATARRPKYLDAFAGSAALAGMQFLYYGQLQTVLVNLPNVDQATHDALTANADVIAFPLNLSAQAGGNLAAVTAALESVKVPSEWVQTTTTYAVILSRIQKLFLFCQRFQGRFKHSLFEAIWNNDVQLQQLPGAVLADMQAAAESLGLDTSGISASTTLRDAVGIMSQRMP